MTVFELYNLVKNKLQNANILEYNTESKIIVEEFCEIPFNKIILNRDILITENVINNCLKGVDERILWKPLQYIIGHWDFYGRKYFVGEGVLIPRSDTEILIDCTLAYAKKHDKNNLQIADLCSGSGCIAITIAKEILNSDVFAIELSKDAIKYLEKNKEFNKATNLAIFQKDVLDLQSISNFKNLDIILSNPPYIKKQLVSSLQNEVLFEPILALDGGEDGLIFYRYIIKYWQTALKVGGFMAFEIGYDQGEAVKNLFEKNGFTNIEILKDYSGNERVVCAKKQY
ncbi:MAG: peptide chain release factor N(5)-glutamine methyltransferase [Oscillospiraceae bacterium]